MKSVMNEQQQEELENLIDIFDNMYFDGEKVQCFQLIKELSEGECDMGHITMEEKAKMQIQLIEAFEWLESLHARVEFKDEYLSYFCSNHENENIVLSKNNSFYWYL